jgi:nucleotidyltransferase substrate binding protein (TIGR01987 family)
MILNTEHLKRCIKTMQSSLTLYLQAEPDSIDQEVFRNAVVKGYELTQETAFKLLKKGLKAFGYGARKLDTTPIKEILRLAANHGLMTVEEVERWFAYRDNRNSTAHDYGEGFAKETLVLIPAFIADATKLEALLREQFGGGENDAKA